MPRPCWKPTGGGDTVVAGETVTGGLGWDNGLCVLSADRRASWSKTSDVVVRAKLLPVDVGEDIAAGAEEDAATAGAVAVAGMGGTGGGVGAAGATVCAGGAEGALACTAGGVGVSGFVELGRLVQASSSNPLITGRCGYWTSRSLYRRRGRGQNNCRASDTIDLC